MTPEQAAEIAVRRKKIAIMGAYKGEKFVFSRLPGGADSPEPVLKGIGRKKPSSQ
ncbi:MAG: hypothetical protein ABI348_05860 [Nitrososphaera sp.]|jgi:hypothetical protein